jgi:hypothetical protein
MKKLIYLIAGAVLGTAMLAGAATTITPIFGGGTGTSTLPAYGKVLVGNRLGTGYDYVATSTLGINAVSSVFSRTGAVTAQSGDYNTGLVTESGNLYYTLPRWATALAGTTTDALPQGITNRYYSTNLFSTDLAATTTTALREGTGLYYTQTRFDAALTATTTLPKITTLAGLTLPSSQISNFGVPFYQFFSATNTTALAEGNNLYYTLSRWATAFAGTTTTALPEGNNLYYTTNRFATELAGTTTNALAQGTTNKYYSTNLFSTDLAATTTTALAEGTRLYYTQTRFDAALTATTTLPKITTLAALTTVGTIGTGVWSGTAVAVNKGGTGQTSFGQGWLASDGTTITSSSSPTFNYITATSTTATSSFAGPVSVGTSTPRAIITSYAVSASSTGLLLEASAKGGCFIMKDVGPATGYTQVTSIRGVLQAKITTSLTRCN